MPVSTSSHLSRYSFNRLISGLTLAATLALQTAPLWQASASTQPPSPAPTSTGLSGTCAVNHTAFLIPIVDRQLIRLEAQLFQNDAQTFQTLYFILESIAAFDDEATQVFYLQRAWLPTNSDRDPIWPEKLAQFAQTEQHAAALYQVDRTLAIVQKLSNNQQTFKAQALITLAQYYQILLSPEQATQTLTLARLIQPHLNEPEIQANNWLQISQLYQVLGDTQAAQASLQAAQTQAQQLDPINSSVQYIEQGIAQRYLEADQPEQALSYANAHRNPVAKALVLNEVAQYYAHDQNQVDQATTLFQQALQLLQNNSNYEGAWWQTLETLAQINPDLALSLMPSESNEFQRLPVFTQAAFAYAQAGNAQKASQMLSQVKANLLLMDGIWRSDSIKTLVSQSMEAELYEFALQTMKTLEPTLDGFTPVTAFQIFIDEIFPVLAEQNNFTLWQQAIEQMPEDGGGSKDEEIARLAVAYTRANQLDQALALAEIPAFSPEATALREIHVRAAIAVALFEAPETVDAGKAMLAELQTMAMGQSDASLAHALSRVLIAYNQANQPLPTDISQILGETIQGIPYPEQDGVALAVIIAFVDNRQFDLALNIAELLDPTVSQIHDLALSYLATIADIDQYSDLILQSIDAQSYPTVQVRILLDVVADNLFEQDPEVLSPYLEKARSLTLTIPGPESEEIPHEFDPSIILENYSDRGSLLETIAMYYSFIGMDEDAIATANLLQDTTLRQKVLTQIRCY
jgi:tetratricopeptide (TPR) repeat protein